MVLTEWLFEGISTVVILVGVYLSRKIRERPGPAEVYVTTLRNPEGSYLVFANRGDSPANVTHFNVDAPDAPQVLGPLAVIPPRSEHRFRIAPFDSMRQAPQYELQFISLHKTWRRKVNKSPTNKTDVLSCLGG